MDMLYTIAIWAIPLVVAITFHEAAHGFVANLLGDDTAKRLGRVTFNPFKHVDRFGTILLPGFLVLVGSPFVFGYAKPVPVDFMRLRPQRLGSALVALAGPGMNIALAVLASLALLAVPEPVSEAAAEDPGFWVANLHNALIINVVLAVFNMLPMLPLDGGRVLAALLPGRLGYLFSKTERLGFLTIVLVFIVPHVLGLGFDPAEYLILSPTIYGVEAILTLTGHAVELQPR